MAMALATVKSVVKGGTSAATAAAATSDASRPPRSTAPRRLARRGRDGAAMDSARGGAQRAPAGADRVLIAVPPLCEYLTRRTRCNTAHAHTLAYLDRLTDLMARTRSCGRLNRLLVRLQAGDAEYPSTPHSGQGGKGLACWCFRLGNAVGDA